MATFPEWGAYAPGLAPVFAISAAYVILGILGHGLMRLVAGPAAADRLARRPVGTGSILRRLKGDSADVDRGTVPVAARMASISSAPKRAYASRPCEEADHPCRLPQ